jgi:hypothetical protein
VGDGVATKYYTKSWTGNFYKATYNKLLARGEDDIFFSGVVVADFTGDGVVDVLQFAGNNAYSQERGTTPSHGQFLLLKGHKNGTFTDATSLLPGSGTGAGPDAGRLDAVMRHLMVGDVNGDGRPDFVGSLSYEDGRLIGAGNGTNVAVQQVAYVSNGAGHWDVVELDNLTWGHGLEVDDFDGDGRDDIITGGFTITPGHQGGTVLSQFPAGGPQINTSLPIDGGTYQLADVDGDGHNELINTYATFDEQGRLATSGLQVLEITGGALGTPIQSPVSSPFRFEEGYEWNGDLAWIAIYKDVAGHEYLYGGISDNLKSADLDGDGKEEIFGLQNRAEIGRRPDGKIDVNLSHDAITKGVFWSWNGTAMVERTDMTVTGFAPALYGIYEYRFVDFNFDGHLDLLVPRPDSGGAAPMQVFLNDGAGHFKVIADKLLPVRLTGGQGSEGEALDINGDRIMDILIRTNGHSEAGNDWGPWGSASETMYLGTTRFHTGPKYTDPALQGAAGFNEQYYLNTYADAKAAVAGPNFATGLEHYLEVGKAKGYFGFAVDTYIFGSSKNDTIKAREGEERLDGGLGNDTLTGKGSADEFVFSTKLGPTNIDIIKDFKPGQGDVIALDRDVFKKVGASLDEAEFHAKSGATKAHDRSDRIVYDPKTGKLFYDADGNKKGGVDAIHFATLSNKALIDEGDFLIV